MEHPGSETIIMLLIKVCVYCLESVVASVCVPSHHNVMPKRVVTYKNTQLIHAELQLRITMDHITDDVAQILLVP